MKLHCSRCKRWLMGLGAALLLLAIASCAALRVPTLPLSGEVELRSFRVSLTGKTVTVDCYLPRRTEVAPVVVVAHGFSRNRRTMAGWGALLAGAGFIAVVPDLPAWSDHPRNGRAVTELLAAVKAEKLFAHPKTSGRAALVGFSAGGWSTLLAAAGSTDLSCWVGLDPVGRGRGDGDAAQRLNLPCFVLRAEPSPWNANGNAGEIFAALPGPAFSLVVNNATHVDAEHPTSRAAEWACGRSDPARREVFGRYLLASLQVGLRRDEAALRQIRAATNDAGVHEVEFRKPEAF